MGPEFDADPMIAEIRRAAFDLRARDPSEAVRVLRRVLKNAGPAEPLVHGALGEILLEDFDDIDGALHHFRRLVASAPHLPAGHIGLARAAARNGDAPTAQGAYASAQAGLALVLRGAQGSPDADHPGAEEALLTALELALEERELLRDSPTGRSPATPASELLDWAEAARIFDADEADDADDWIRYARLRAALEAADGRRDAAESTVARVSALAHLPADRTAFLRSCAHEAVGDLAAAAREAAAAVGTLDGAFEAEEVLRAAALMERAGDTAGARTVLERLRARLERERERAVGDDRDSIDALLEEVRALATSTGPQLVGLGVGRRPS